MCQQVESAGFSESAGDRMPWKGRRIQIRRRDSSGAPRVVVIDIESEEA